MFGKMYIDLQRLQPISFSLTPDAVDIVQYYWQIIVTDGVSYDSGKIDFGVMSISDMPVPVESLVFF